MLPHHEEQNIDVGAEDRHIFEQWILSRLNLFGVDMDIPSLEKSNESLDFLRDGLR